MQDREILRKLTRSTAPISLLKLAINAKGIKYDKTNAYFQFGYCDKYDRVHLAYFPYNKSFTMMFYKGSYTQHDCVKIVRDVHEDMLNSTFDEETGLMI